MKKLLIILAFAAVIWGGTKVATAAINTIESSTMYFSTTIGGDLTNAGGGVYTGTIAMSNEGIYGGGFDVYAKQGAEAYVEGYYGTGPWNGPGGNDTYIVGYYAGTDHDAYPPETAGGPWGSWYDPDVADWDKYHLTLTADSWALVYTPTGESPMGGTMTWAGDGTGFAAETAGMPGYWDQTWSWGTEAIPLELPGFRLAVTTGSYHVTMTPAPEPCSLLIWSLLGPLGLTAGWWRRRRKAA